MSHLKERKEKICLNCHTALSGRYCHVCGQENLEPKETVLHLILHFFNDITHFDGKFFSTGKYLIRKPGFLSKEYVAGRRASYLNPIRMYVFTSAIFFLILFSLKKPDDLVHMNMNLTPENQGVRKNLAELEQREKELETKLNSLTDFVDKEDKQDLQEQIIKRKAEIAAIKTVYGDTTTRTFSSKERKAIVAQEKKVIVDTGFRYSYRYKSRDSSSQHAVVKQNDTVNSKDNDMSVLGTMAGGYETVEVYDSAQQKLPEDQRDGWFSNTMKRKIIAAASEFRHDRKHYLEHFLENLLHSFPKILFFSLPFFALILNILYFRRKKEFYYVDHGIFTIHVYCATFILIMAIVLLQKLSALLGWGWFGVLTNISIFFLVLYIMIYLYKAMRGFYGQGRFKTFIKYSLACMLAFIVNTILLILFILISAISI
ncbi:DUF3667 domain-containing protein [Flavitalea flava]